MQYLRTLRYQLNPAKFHTVKCNLNLQINCNFGMYNKRKRLEHRRNGKGDGDQRQDNSNSHHRHPSHLRGKAIGMFYAQRSKEKKKIEENAPARPMGTVLLSETKKEQINQLLKSTTDLIDVETSDDASLFKRKFLKMITGSIEEKLDKATKVERNPNLDEQLLEEFQTRKDEPRYRRMLTKRQRLPSFTKREEILKLINDNRVVVISGETGCGKTTQVAQFILDDYVEKGQGSLCHVVCTQPRRISAISVAERVAEERAEALGNGVGYHIRLEKKLPRDKGSIVFCTTGVVLKQMEGDPSLSNVSHVILDEIHERDIMSDFLIALLKQVLTKRSDLKLILMSATLNAEKFSNYYNGCPHINIPGFTYPVEEFYLEDVLQRTGFSLEQCSKRPKGSKSFQGDFQREFLEPHVRKLESLGTYSRQVCIQLRNPQIEEINLDMILALIISICQKEKDEGAILVFLTGFAEISSLNQLMENSGKFPKNKFLIIPLHSRMPTVNQRQVFERPPSGTRKIVLSTNIAETSITIDDVVFVIDCGKIKMTNFDADTNTHTLKPEWVSLANASQRKGRAGRVQPGVCFHLFTRARNMVLEEYQKPEILRTRLENTILTIKVLQLGKIEPFLNRLMDSPQPEAVAVSVELLKRLNALDENETLTPLGYHLAKLPLGPQMGKMILLGAIFSCLDPVLSVAASLDFKDAFQTPLGKEKQVDAKKLQLSNGWRSDHLLLHQALNQFEKEDYHGGKRFCWEYFLSWHTLTQLQNMKRQFMEYLYEMDFVNSKDPGSYECNRNSDNLSLVKAVICAGLYPNVAKIRATKRRNIIRTIEGEKVELHPKSVLCKELCFESPLLVYYLKLRSSSNYIHDATLVHPLPLIFFGDNYKYTIDDGGTNISIGSDRLRFKCSRSTNAIIKELRDRLNWFLEYKVSNPGIVNWQPDGGEAGILKAVIELITSEDMGDMDLDAFDDDD